MAGPYRTSPACPDPLDYHIPDAELVRTRQRAMIVVD
jgi:hypothetical protein